MRIEESTVFLQPREEGPKHNRIASVSAKVEGRAYDV